MTVLTPSVIARISKAVERFLPDKCIIQSLAATDDGFGGQTIGWTNETTGVQCLIPSGSFEGGARALRRTIIRMPVNTTVDHTRRVVQTHSQGVAISPRYFGVETVLTNGSFEVLIRVQCIEVTPLDQLRALTIGADAQLTILAFDSNMRYAPLAENLTTGWTMNLDGEIQIIIAEQGEITMEVLRKSQAFSVNNVVYASLDSQRTRSIVAGSAEWTFPVVKASSDKYP